MEFCVLQPGCQGKDNVPALQYATDDIGSNKNQALFIIRAFLASHLTLPLVWSVIAMTLLASWLPLPYSTGSEQVGCVRQLCTRIYCSELFF